MADVIATGPVFDGRAIAESVLYCKHVEEVIGGEAVNRIKAYLPTQYKYLGHSGGNPKDNPVPADAGYYESQIQTDMAFDGMRVTDDSVAYGPWLEGVGSMNSVKRFPGYGTFRIIGHEIDQDSLRMSLTELPPYIAAMNA